MFQLCMHTWAVFRHLAFADSRMIHSSTAGYSHPTTDRLPMAQLHSIIHTQHFSMLAIWQAEELGSKP